MVGLMGAYLQFGFGVSQAGMSFECSGQPCVGCVALQALSANDSEKLVTLVHRFDDMPLELPIRECEERLREFFQRTCGSGSEAPLERLDRIRRMTRYGKPRALMLLLANI